MHLESYIKRILDREIGDEKLKSLNVDTDNLVKELTRVSKGDGSDGLDVDTLLAYLGYEANNNVTKLAILFIAISKLASYDLLKAEIDNVTSNIYFEISDVDCLALISKVVDWKVYRRKSNKAHDKANQHLALMIDELNGIKQEECSTDEQEEAFIPKELEELIEEDDIKEESHGSITITSSTDTEKI